MLTLKPGDVGVGKLYNLDDSGAVSTPCCSVGWLRELSKTKNLTQDQRTKWCRTYIKYATSVESKRVHLNIDIVTLNDHILSRDRRAMACNVAFAAIGLCDDPEVLDILRGLNLG